MKIALTTVDKRRAHITQANVVKMKNLEKVANFDKTSCSLLAKLNIKHIFSQVNQRQFTCE